MKVVVTGSAGFVGSHVVRHLLDAGHDLVTVDRQDGHEISDMTEDHFDGVDAIVHCAAYADLRHNWDGVAERGHQMADNVDATIAILELMPSVPLIFTSSASVYGSICAHFDDMSVAECMADPETIESPYAATKLACEALIAAYAYKRGFPWYALRLVNQVGARSHRGVIADFVRMATPEPHHIHAADNGEQRKSWIHVEDTADAILAILDKRPPSGVYNMTSDTRISWHDIVEIMRETRPVSVSCTQVRKGAVGDPEDVFVSGAKLAPWFVAKRDVRDGIREALVSLGWR